MRWANDRSTSRSRWDVSDGSRAGGIVVLISRQSLCDADGAQQRLKRRRIGQQQKEAAQLLRHLHHHELALDAEDVILLRAELQIGRRQHRRRHVHREARRRWQEHDVHEFAQRVHVRRAEDVPRLLERGLLHLAELLRRPRIAVEHQLSEAQRGWPGKDEHGASGEIAEHVHQHRRDRLVGLGHLRRDLLETRDIDCRDADHDRPSNHLRERGRGGPGADVRYFLQRIELDRLERADVVHGYGHGKLLTSTISAGEPFPRIVAPPKNVSPSFTPSNCLTTISCCPPSASTTRPTRRSGRSMTMTCSLGCPAATSRRPSPTNPRSRSTGSTSERSTSTSRPCSVRNAASWSSTVSDTWVSGIAYTSSATRASSARTIASVSGSRSVAVVPWPGAERMSTAPPSARTRV